MSEYKYTDEDGDTLWVSASIGAPGAAVVTVGECDTYASMRVSAAESPALALAILEATGIDGNDEDANPHLAAAFTYLQAHVAEAVERAAVEREAEDAAALAWFHACWPGESSSPDFPGIDDGMRRAYRASRDLHARADADAVAAEVAPAPAPRVVDRGDPEPDRAVKWRDKDGDVWGWREDGDQAGWRFLFFSTCYSWSELQDRAIAAFPWTEVTGRA